MDLNEFIRQNEKMNSSLITDWSREMILEAFQIWTDKQLLINGVVKSFCECTDEPMRLAMSLTKCAACQKIVED